MPAEGLLQRATPPIVIEFSDELRLFFATRAKTSGLNTPPIHFMPFNKLHIIALHRIILGTIED